MGKVEKMESKAKVFTGENTGLRFKCTVKNGSWEEFHESLNKKFGVVDPNDYPSVTERLKQDAVT
jgi:hypothetical protein